MEGSDRPAAVLEVTVLHTHHVLEVTVFHTHRVVFSHTSVLFTVSSVHVKTVTVLLSHYTHQKQDAISSDVVPVNNFPVLFSSNPIKRFKQRDSRKIQKT